MARSYAAARKLVGSDGAPVELPPCRFGCRAPAVAVVYYPRGCLCLPDRFQALCAQHAQRGLDNNEGYVLLDLREAGERD